MACLDIGGDADAAQLAARRRFLPTLLEAGVVRAATMLERLEVTPLSRERRWRGVGKASLATKCGAKPAGSMLHLAGCAIDEALNDIEARAPGAAIASTERCW
jgi:hypothetical protein